MRNGNVTSGSMDTILTGESLMQRIMGHTLPGKDISVSLQSVVYL